MWHVTKTLNDTMSAALEILFTNFKKNILQVDTWYGGYLQLSIESLHSCSSCGYFWKCIAHESNSVNLKREEKSGWVSVTQPNSTYELFIIGVFVTAAAVWEDSSQARKKLPWQRNLARHESFGRACPISYNNAYDTPVCPQNIRGTALQRAGKRLLLVS